MQTKQLSEFVYQLRSGDLPPGAVEAGKKSVEDLIGAAIAGSRSGQGGIWRSYFTRPPQLPEASVWAPRFPRCTAAQAAALNAAWAHILDMDDVHNGSVSHLGAVTIPAALALGQRLHRSGREVLCAVAAGYEVGARVGEAITPGSYYYWHTTGLVGPLAAAAAAGTLLRLSPDHLLHALGSAGTQAAGLWEFLSDGAMSKPLHTANATLCGIRSAELAALGLTGASRILEGGRGLLRAVSPEYHPEFLTRDLDPARLKLAETSLKPYPCCRHTHGAVYAAGRLRAQAQFTPDDVVEITDRTYRLAVQTVDAPSPATPYACKFSAQYCISAMLLRDSLAEDAFTPGAASDPAQRELMARVRVVEDGALEALHRSDPACWPHLLEITLRDGTVLRLQVDYPPGDVRNPFDWDAVDRKFRAATAGLLPDAQARRLCGAIRRLEELEDVNELFAGLGAEIETGGYR